MQQLGFEMVFVCRQTFAQALCAALHGAHMRGCADAGSATHGVLLVGVFDEAHFIEPCASVLLNAGAGHTHAHTGAHFVQPAFNLRGQTLVRGKRKPDGLAVFQQAWQTVLDVLARPGVLHAQCGRCCVGAQTVAIPDLTLLIFFTTK